VGVILLLLVDFVVVVVVGTILFLLFVVVYVGDWCWEGCWGMSGRKKRVLSSRCVFVCLFLSGGF
jgi:hypothetical protein